MTHLFAKSVSKTGDAVKFTKAKFDFGSLYNHKLLNRRIEKSATLFEESALRWFFEKSSTTQCFRIDKEVKNVYKAESSVSA